MKKIILSVITLSLVGAVALAADEDPMLDAQMQLKKLRPAVQPVAQQVREEVVDAVQNTNQLRQQEMTPEAQNQLQERLQAKKNQYLKNKLGLMGNRLQAYLSKAKNIDARFEKRLTLLEEKGFDVSELESMQADAQSWLTSAEENAQKFRELIQSAADAADRDELKTILDEAREYIKAYKEDIKSYFDAMKELLEEVRELLKAQRPEVPEPEVDVVE